MKTLSERLSGLVEKTAKFQPVSGTREQFNDKDLVEDLLDTDNWEDPKREVVFRWLNTEYGLRLAFVPKGSKYVSYCGLARGLQKEPLKNPVLQLFTLTRDTVIGDRKLTAGSHFLFVIGSGDVEEMKEGFEADEHPNKDARRTLKTRRVHTNGVDA